MARKGLEVGVLIKVYQVGQQAAWEYVLDVALREVPPGGPNPTDVLVLLWSHAGLWINQSVQRLIEVFDDERERLRQGAMARRMEIVTRILRGDAVDVAEVSSALRHPMALEHTAYILWVDDDDAVSSMDPIAAYLAKLLGTASPLAVMAGGRARWCWVATSRQHAIARLKETTDMLAGKRVRAAFGSTGSGLAGFRASHGQALAAQRLAIAASYREPLIMYTDVELVSLMSADQPAARAFVHRTLGKLAGNEKGMDRIRQTVHAVTDAGGNLDAAATCLSVHKNTVRYRLEQAEAILGHPLRERRADIEIALRFLDVYGEL
jgi:DNA-binding PucR family transcriptional regulator